MGTAVLSIAAILLFAGLTLVSSSVPYKPITKCGAYEVYSECGNNACQNTCANPNIAPLCKAACKCGCICIEGYLRNSKGVCVKPEKCDTCKANEVFSEYGNHPCQNTCAEPDLLPRCSYVAGRYPGCICKPGYLRNGKGICVLKKDCVIPPTCDGANEEYSECGNDSCQKSCETYSANYACRPSCNSGCICKRGFIRNNDGVCVNPADCENNVCPKQNEAYSNCVSPCGETCATLGKNIICNFLVCNGGCNCKSGFFRNSKGVCVSPEECDCPEFEEKVKCPNSCPPETCDSIGKLFKCAVVDPTKCKPQCKCILNYKRNEDRVCVHISNCPAPFTCSANEVYDACPAKCHDDTCDQSQKQGCITVPEEKYSCLPKCVCAEGYRRNSEGTCIPINDCVVSCGGDSNTVFDPCGDPCPLTCNNKNNPILCDAVCIKGGGCRCKDGYFRDINNRCILPHECPKCGENEFFDCGSECDTTCATLGQICPFINKKCVEKCYCVPGYARNDKNVCIPIEQCPPGCNGDPNAVYVECASACPITCDNKDSPPKMCTFNCKSPPCQCKPGYIEDRKGKCIRPVNCPKKCPTNQVYNVCPKYCPPEQTCKDYFDGIVYDCARASEDLKCVPRCECKTGYIRRETNGDCIKPGQCCQDPNAEVVKCPNPCPGGTCESPAFTPCFAGCRFRGCQCKKRYVKDILGKCIPLSKCPPKCCVNEVSVACKDKCPPTCKSITSDDVQIMCMPPNPCPAGCDCKPGYVRNSENLCVKAETCSCPDPNAEVKLCPNPCPGGTCDSPEFAPCKRACKMYGCQCRPGYVKDAAGKCILLEKCPVKCKANEIWNPCIGYCSFDKTCSRIIDGLLPGCPPPPEDYQCGGGCVCLEGYVRTNNECVPEATCCGDPNSEMTSCPMPCHETCFAIPDPACEAEKCFEKGCKCKSGFVKDDSDTCIRREDCPVCSDPNAEMIERPNLCSGGTCEHPGFRECDTARPAHGCQCKPGYFKKSSTDATCIRADYCPALIADL